MPEKGLEAATETRGGGMPLHSMDPLKQIRTVLMDQKRSLGSNMLL